MFNLYPQIIFNSRGNLTLKVTLVNNNYLVFASIPSGKSVSSKEAKQLSVDDAVQKIKNIIEPQIKSMDLRYPDKIDKKLMELDGTKNKTNLGSNTLLAVSLAVYKAASIENKIPLYQQIGLIAGKTNFHLPKPLINVINGGVHGHQTLEFQEFHLVPNFSNLSLIEQLTNSHLVFQKLSQILTTLNIPWGYGDEGGITCYLFSNQEPFELLNQAIEAAGFSTGKDFFFSLDSAANSFYQENKYHLKEKSKSLNSKDLLNYYHQLVTSFPLKIIEDPFAEDDKNGWKLIKSLNQKNKTIIVGDDLTSTNPYLLEKLSKNNFFNAVLIKPNQIGTVLESIEFAQKAKKLGLILIASHRSGESCDPFIADLAVGIGASYVKFGNLRQGERIIKYNRLLEIEEELNK